MQRQGAADAAAKTGKKPTQRPSAAKAAASPEAAQRPGFWKTLRAHPRVVVVGLLILLVSAEVAWLLHDPSHKASQAQASTPSRALASASDWLPKKCRVLEALHLGQCNSPAV